MPGTWRIEVRYFPENYGKPDGPQNSMHQSIIIADDELEDRRAIGITHDFAKLFTSVCQSISLAVSSRL